MGWTRWVQVRIVARVLLTCASWILPTHGRCGQNPSTFCLLSFFRFSPGGEEAEGGCRESKEGESSKGDSDPGLSGSRAHAATTVHGCAYMKLGGQAEPPAERVGASVKVTAVARIGKSSTVSLHKRPVVRYFQQAVASRTTFQALARQMTFWTAYMVGYRRPIQKRQLRGPWGPCTLFLVQ